MNQGLYVPWMKGYLPLERKKLPTRGSGAVCSLEEGVLTLREEEAANLWIRGCLFLGRRGTYP